ncbi:MAG TPA: CHAP domain-containing protein [Gemmatimonadota bacterium]|nr:CHAP domain-containing protein [Gemmatimonadota bacterium]
MASTIRFGSKGKEVAQLVALLTKQGCAPVTPVTGSEPEFNRDVENMVLYFQMTHQGKDGKWLDVDGVVGPGTWWALENATGEPQRSFLEAGIPEGITDKRRAILEAAVKQHGVREEGSKPNRGKDVDKFLPKDFVKSPKSEGPPWCCYFASWVVKEAYGEHPLGEPVASVHTSWQLAKKHGHWEPNDGRLPTPGDAFVLLHDDPEKGWCTGHIGFVLQVAPDGKSINTVEGNCGNRVKIGRRELSDPMMKGFINVVGDHPEFERGSLRGAPDLGKSGTR